MFKSAVKFHNKAYFEFSTKGRRTYIMAEKVRSRFRFHFKRAVNKRAVEGFVKVLFTER